MQVGKQTVPLPMSFDPLSPRGQAPTAGKALRRVLISQASEKVFQETRKALSEGVRKNQSLKGRQPLYEELGNRFGALQSSVSTARTAASTATSTATSTVSAPTATGQTASTEIKFSPLDDLKQTSLRLSDTLSLLDAATTGGKAGYRDDALLRDLRDTLGAFFKGDGDSNLQSLGDLGFSRSEGQLNVDETRLSKISLERPDELAAFATTFYKDQLAPLLAEGQQALNDAQARTPFDQRLAEQRVHVRAELSRLQSRQQLLLFQQTSNSEVQERLKSQAAVLEKAQDALNEAPAPITDSAKQATPPESGSSGSRRTPPAQANAAVGNAPQAPGLLSFGLS